MKKSLSIFCFMAAMLATLSSWAKPVSADQARRVAVSFLQGIGCKQAANCADRSSALPFHNFYLFASDEGGFVLVAAADCVTPILGYSASNHFAYESLPAHVADWLGGYEEQIAYYVKQDEQQRASGLRQHRGTEPSVVDRQWQMLLDGQMPPAVQNTTVTPLLTTTWNQSPLYNNLCPADNGSSSGHAVAGCTAIATAQVMKYWNHPATGYGSHSYSHYDYGTLSANFGSTTYQWAQMPGSLSSSSTQAQVSAVATLIYHVGVAVEMDYGADGSGARTVGFGDLATPSAENALRYYFKYAPSLHSINRSDYAPAQFAAMLTNELTNSRPIIFTGYDVDAGHAFVLDGVNNSGDFHVNWGWGGYCDGYYTMGALNPSTGGTGGNTSGTYNIDNSAIIGIQPCTNFDPTGATNILGSASNSSMGSVSGSGTYLFGDTVSLLANAASGCRFLQWSDGDKHNPRTFIATGGSHTYTATYEQLHGDTLGYATSDTWLTSFGGTGSADWGIRIPASALTATHDLKKVQLMVSGAGSYTVTIYAGSLAQTPVSTQDFNATAAEVGEWKTVALSTPVPVTGSQDIWITFHNSDVSYPAALTYDCGNDDGMLWTTAYTSIRSTWNYTFMIRGIFEQSTTASGDTLSYCGNSGYATSIGAGGSLHWGIQLPAAMLAGRSAVSAVQLYVTVPGSYQLRLSQGGSSAPAAPIMTQTAVFSDADTGRWNTITLPHALAIDSTLPLWAVFYNGDNAYPAAGCAPVSDFNGSWVSTDGSTWSSLYAASGTTLNYTWMIRCITSSDTPAPGVSIDGPVSFATNTAQTFTASCNYPGATYTWTMPGASSITGTGNTRTAQWTTPGTYNVVVAAAVNSTMVYDTMQVTVYSCDIVAFPYLLDFEGDCSCWGLNDADGDQYCWQLLGDSSAHSGFNMLVSASFVNNVGALTPDNWLISPAITIPQGHTATLSWYVKGLDANYAAEYYSVYLSTSGTTPSDFTAHQLYTGYSNGTWTQQTVSLNAYAGQTIHIAFRHHNITDMYYICLDDIAVSTTAPATTYTITATANNPAYGTVTGGGTYNAGTSVTLTATPNTGYEFVQWNDGNTQASRTITVTANATYTAIFQSQPATTYTVTATANNPAYGTVTGGGTYNAGTSVTLTATPNAGYEFVQWNDGNTQASRTIIVTANATYTANFQPRTTNAYTITVTANNPAYGIVTGGGTYNAGTAVTLSAIPNTGYEFVQWNDGETQASRTITVTADATYTANFQPRTFVVNITADDPAHGSVTGGGSYAYMVSVTATATPFSGYVFAGWSNGESHNPYTFTVTENIDLQARFLPETGIDPAEADCWTAFADRRNIVVRHAGRHALRLYDVSGRLVASADKAGDEQRFIVSHGGIYFIVADDGSAQKVIVL